MGLGGRKICDLFHGNIRVRGVRDKDGHVRGEARKRITQDFTVHAHQRHRAQLVRVRGNELINRSTFELAAGHPHDGARAGQRRIRGVRVGRFGVIHPVHAIGAMHNRAAVALHVILRKRALNVFGARTLGQRDS